MSPTYDGQTLEHLQVAIIDALLSLKIHVPSNLFESQLENNAEALSLVQRLSWELWPESVTTFHDAFSFAHSIGFDLVEGTDANVAISELMYFLAIELQIRKLLGAELSKEQKKPDPHTGEVEPSHTAVTVDDDVPGFHLSPASQQLLDFISCTLRHDYQNRTGLITLRLKLTAESFLEKETAEPLNVSQEKLNNLIQSIQNDESCLLSSCQDSNENFGLINTYRSSEENNNNLGEHHDKIPTNAFAELNSQNIAHIGTENQLDGTLPYKKTSSRSKRYQERKDNRQKSGTSQRVQHDKKQGGKRGEMPTNKLAELTIRSHGENSESKNLVETSPQRTKSICANDPQIDSNGQLPTKFLDNDDIIVEPNSLVESLPRKTKSRRANNRQKNVKRQVGQQSK